MTDADYEALKAATARLEGGGFTGTGYLVASKRVATCAHVVRKWPEGKGLVFLGPDQVRVNGKVKDVDKELDCAIVELLDDVDARPLPLDSRPSRKAIWEGFGFPATAKGAGLPMDGHVADPDIKDDRNVPSILLYSKIVAAGQASPLHGFSGSPALVQGAVVGHLRKHLGDPDDRTRGAYGYVYACPVTAVRALLGDIQIESRDIDQPLIESVSDHFPRLADDHFHVFISYRSTDKSFALKLVDRLEGAGLRVYLAEHEIRPGNSVVAGLNTALANSSSAIAIVSKGWLESEWCQAEGNNLMGRDIQDKAFRLIPLRIDDSKLPAFMSDLKYLDADPDVFDSEIRGAELVKQLMWGLVDKPMPKVDSAAGKVESEESEAVERFLFRLKLAADRDPTHVISVWEDWKLSGLSDTSPALKAAEILIGKARPDLALKVLDALEEPGLRARQLRGLALSKSGDDRRDDAIEVFEQLRAEGHRDPETTGNLAAAYKARWKQAGDAGTLRKAYDLYLECYEQTGDTWNGINAAALALRVGKKEQSRELADKLAGELEKKPVEQRSHWHWATLGEAYLLARNEQKAADRYRKASTKAGGLVRNIAVMREGARDDLEALGEDRNAFDGNFTVPTVVAFVGHMTDLPNRPGPSRFPIEKSGEVHDEIHKRLEKLKPVHGFSGIARGSDIIFIEALLSVGGKPHVILPLPEADFRRVSVGGFPWDERYDELIKKVEVKQLHDDCPPDEELRELFQKANREVQQRAIKYAEALFDKPRVIAVWDGKPGDGKGGTADAVQRWQIDGYHVDIIDITAL